MLLQERTCDLENEFRCSNGLCLDNFWLCDGIKHCNDSGDENELMCKVSIFSFSSYFKVRLVFAFNSQKCLRETVLHSCVSVQLRR